MNLVSEQVCAQLLGDIWPAGFWKGGKLRSATTHGLVVESHSAVLTSEEGRLSKSLEH